MQELKERALRCCAVRHSLASLDGYVLCPPVSGLEAYPHQAGLVHNRKVFGLAVFASLGGLYVLQCFLSLDLQRLPQTLWWVDRTNRIPLFIELASSYPGYNQVWALLYDGNATFVSKTGCRVSFRVSSSTVYFACRNSSLRT